MSARIWARTLTTHDHHMHPPQMLIRLTTLNFTKSCRRTNSLGSTSQRCKRSPPFLLHFNPWRYSEAMQSNSLCWCWLVLLPMNHALKSHTILCEPRARNSKAFLGIFLWYFWEEASTRLSVHFYSFRFEVLSKYCGELRKADYRITKERSV